MSQLNTTYLITVAESLQPQLVVLRHLDDMQMLVQPRDPNPDCLDAQFVPGLTETQEEGPLKIFRKHFWIRILVYKSC